MKKINLNPASILERDIQEIAQVLEAGGVVAVPTETVYGLVCHIQHAASIERIYRIKNRSLTKPLPVFIHSMDQFRDLADSPSEEILKLAHHFWPGPLTMVVNAKHDKYPEVTRGTGKIGIRMPDMTLMLKLISALNSPLASTSANISSESPCKNLEELDANFLETLDLVVDAGVIGSGTPSTVLDVSVNPFQVLRQGEIQWTDIEKVLKS